MHPVVETGIEVLIGEASMLKGRTPRAAWDQAKHERWLAMKAAYNRYINASAALDELTEELGDVQVRLLHEQRLAYEEYIEARLTFSESLLPQFGAGVVGRQSNQVASQFWTRRVFSKLAIQALAIGLLCITALGLVYRMYERPRMLETYAAVVNQTCDDRLTSRSNGSNAVPRVPTQSVGGSPPVPIRPAVRSAILATAPTRVVARRWRRVQVSVPRERNGIGYAQPVKPQRNGKRVNYEFTLRLTPQFERIGPVHISLRRIDLKHNDFDVFLLSGNLRINEKHIRLYEPIWIRIGGQAEPVQLLTDRIGKNYVHGYLCNSRCNKRELMPGLMQRADAGFRSQQFFRF
jgi:hypothetical protein